MCLQIPTKTETVSPNLLNTGELHTMCTIIDGGNGLASMCGHFNLPLNLWGFKENSVFLGIKQEDFLEGSVSPPESKKKLLVLHTATNVRLGKIKVNFVIGKQQPAQLFTTVTAVP